MNLCSSSLQDSRWRSKFLNKFDQVQIIVHFWITREIVYLGDEEK